MFLTHLCHPTPFCSIDALGLICTFAIVCNAPFDDKINFVFDTFDFNQNGSISKDELTIVAMAALLGMVRYTRPGADPPGDERCEEFADRAFKDIDRDANGSISRAEFFKFVKSELDADSSASISTDEMLAYFGLAMLNAGSDSESAADDSDVAVEADEGGSIR